MNNGALQIFHPAVARWFERSFPAPTEAQSQAWPQIKQQRHTLIAAPTGSGKTLAAFLSAIDDLVRLGVDGQLDDTTHVIYVSPLKALSNDVQRNLQTPLEGIQKELQAMGLPEVNIRTLVRTGDTPASERTAMTKRPPHVVVTTPESLYILLTSEGGRRMLETARTLIVDEIHAVVSDKRGSHLALSIERLEQLTSNKLVRIGLSATQRPIEEVARFLIGNDNSDCAIIDSGHARQLDVAIELTDSPLQAVMSGEVWEEVYDRLAQLIRQHHTTLVFVNTRRLAERVSRHLGERLGDENIAAHHGSLAREQRLSAEQRLKAGELSALVATASLELGIDIGDVNLVCQIGSTRTIASFLQRVGRSNHTVAGFPKGRIFPLSRDELVECASIVDSVRRGELDRLEIPERPLDILAQQIVAAVAAEEWTEDDLFAMVRRAYPYRNLEREQFDAIVRMLAEGFSTKRGRRSTYLHHDAVNQRLRGRRGARLAAITSGGAIPDTADYAVVLEPGGLVIGTVNEDFAIESLQGDIFQLGNTSWRVLRVEQGKVRVEDAHGQPPSIPFWLGEAPARSHELSVSVSRLREEVAARVSNTEFGAAIDWLTDEVGLSQSAAEQIVEYLAGAKIVLGVMPSQDNLVLERFFDDSGSMQLVLHSPFGSRLNRAWGLALRKRFCRKFNFELQAAATEDAIVLSLGPTHSFPLDDVFHYLNSKTVRQLLCQALLDAPMWNIRWRWNVTRSLAVLRRRGGKKIPPQLQRMDAEDLLTAIFPDQVACAENLGGGEREIPSHPLVDQTVKDCLEEAMDIDGLERLLASIERNEKNLFARDVIEASPLSQEILNARPYAYLDDAPLEERRTRAVFQRRWLDPETASDLGKLDQAAIDRVREEVWPDPRNADELHDALVELGFVEKNAEWQQLFNELTAERRAAVLVPDLWVAAERLPQIKAIFPNRDLAPPITAPESISRVTWTAEEALTEVLRGRLEGLGPVTVEALMKSSGLTKLEIETGLLRLEAEGFVIRGRFTPGATETEWCARRLLARIHSYTLNRLRQEIEPVASTDFIRFLLAWQKVAPEHQVEGPESVRAIIDQLEGFEAPAAAWEGELLPARLVEYDPAWLDALCLSGEVVWARLTPPVRSSTSDGTRGSGPVRNTPIALLRRKNFALWNAVFPQSSQASATSEFSTTTQLVYDYLSTRGASFFTDIVENTELLRSQVEEALAELVAAGVVVSDSFTGLRALLTPGSRKTQAAARRKHRQPVYDMASAGRWSILKRAPAPAAAVASTQQKSDLELAEQVAWVLLRRYGVVFKRLLEREGMTVPWRVLLRVYHRLEARGEIRGGRFVANISGEQFALPEAVGMLRSIRREGAQESMISVSAADPLNLAGIITPGNRITAHTGNRILYHDGAPIAALESGETHFLVELSRAIEWQAKSALVRKATRPELRSYLRRPA
ncbi:MAG TPA: DEAD/DEAH box helicase [Pyrinomonadaceae bacterium]|nr:DEAD/DEAH box helicase [Pyrinomonadaceae bacterium]